MRTNDVEAPHEFHDDPMDDMIETLVTNTMQTDTKRGQGSRAQDPKEQFIKNACKEPLYEGAKVSKLRALLSILNLQATFGWSDASVSALFQLMQKILPDGNCMPDSRADAKKLLSTIGMDYRCIHACPNDCILYDGEFEALHTCPKCGLNRYREDLQGTQIPCKVVRHFPIIPRIRHMFRCKSIAAMMSWHKKGRSKDGILRVPADCNAWKHIEEQWSEFAKEPRHLRFGLATDGVNPYGLRSTKWSTWPVVLVNYNIPPWLCIKKGHLLLSLIIPGKRKPRNLQVYMAPLLQELQMLWNGIDVVDNSRSGKSKYFKLRAILMWTLHDYPGYGDVAGLSTSGHYACPPCGMSLTSRYSVDLKKVVYEGHRKYFDEGCSKRRNVRDVKPTVWKAKDWFEHWEKSDQMKASTSSSKKKMNPGMKTLNCFHSLPYWHNLLINHLLDPMHIFKNVSQLIWDHITGKRDSIGCRKDLEKVNRMPHLWIDESGNKPPAPWVLSKQEMTVVKAAIEKFRTPTGTMRSLSGCFTTDDDLSGLKSHDWHKVLQV